MYNLISKYNLSSAIKNESLGLWYDVKTKISSIMSDLRNKVNKKSKLPQPALSKGVFYG